MIQLRVRTEFFFGETFAPLAKVAERLKAMGVTAAGIVDPGTWGHVKWNDAMKKAGIQPMFGTQIAVVRELDSEDRPAMWFLALSSEGLQELYRFSSLAHRQAVRGSPRLSYDDVRKMSDQIAKFAGAVLDGPFLREVGAYLDLDPGSPIANRRKLSMSRELGLQTVLVSDNLYPAPEDRQTFELIGRQSKPTPQYLMTHSALVQACGLSSNGSGEQETAARIAEAAKEVKLPFAPIIKVDGDLEALCRAGIPDRFPDGWTEEYEKRLQYELGLIRSKEFESYFLMVADMVRYAKTRMLVGPSRGSAAGSLVCYLTRITEVDPIPPKLIFERFIDVTRKDLPDIDLDFVDSKRHLVIEYLREKYGQLAVAQIGNVATFQPKSALDAVGKRLGVPPWEVKPVKDAIFERSSGDSRANFALLDTLAQTDPGRKLLDKFPAMALAANIEAHAQHTSVHASGVLVCNLPIENFCTITADGIAQIDKKDAEKLNLLKMDVLGLRTLGVLEDSGVKVDWYGLTFDDPAVWKVINEKRYAGVFQFEGPALQGICSQMTVGSLDDLGHVTALARPGPMSSGGATAYLQRRAGKEAFSVPHPSLLKYVSDTYGVVIYQEQVLQICRELGRMSWDDVTLLRKAMSKTLGKEYFDQFRDKFVAGAKENGIDEGPATAIWEMVNTMGSWAFNLAHSFSYAVVSYWTAWLKAHHPLEFAAATLRNVKNDESAIAILRELVNEGITYIPFDPELSEVTWSVKDGKLIGGFTGLYGIGASKAEAYIAERNERGRLSDESLAKLNAAKRVYGDLFPAHSRFQKWYDDPVSMGCARGTKIVNIEDIGGEGEYVYIGELVGKDLGDYNEAIRIKRRNGRRFQGQTLFLDLTLKDDTAKVLTRIDRFEFESLGRKIWEEAAAGTWWLVRGRRNLWGKPDSGFKMIYVTKIMQLTPPEGM